MKKVSAGVLVYRWAVDGVELFIAHPGGPYFSRKEEGVWTIPKGMIEDGESPSVAARREFSEETGFACPGQLIELGTVKLRSGKTIHAFGAEGDFDPSLLQSNAFELEWPRGSGKRRSFPEIDRVEFVTPMRAKVLLHPIQAELVDRLLRALRD
ncbi:MAG: NUDIX domain-containing protein [Myxococcales bacterium]|nr:NUDIX domain-containing protein [Myxococcales bacterium]